MRWLGGLYGSDAQPKQPTPEQEKIKKVRW